VSHLLIVDDEPSICWGLAKLGRDLGHTVAVAPSAEQALVAARSQRPEAIVLDVRLPGMDGLTAMLRFQEELGPVPIVVVTAYGELSTAVEAVRRGASDYLVKPFDLNVAERAIERALQKAAAAAAEALPTAGPPNHAEQIVGTSPAMQEVFKRIAVVAPTDACVHLHGESGTGKELVARAIHRYSRRSGGPFVAVSVASLSPTLAESELFGHARGAFTGAEHSRPGLLEQADGGTIFLDEVADIPLALQVKLLRFLEHGEVLPVGSTIPVRSDFRVVSATHQSLRQRVAEGTFRHDLFFRLLTFEIEIPPLRDRPQDLRELADYFLETLAAKTGHQRPALAPETVADLETRRWYGNVRELRNALEHALILARGRRFPGALAAARGARSRAAADRERARPGRRARLARSKLDGSRTPSTPGSDGPLSAAAGIGGAAALTRGHAAERWSVCQGRALPGTPSHYTPQETGRAGHRRGP
jgi:two-component system, NtrC family, nitrogen regulation response regulator GlnG